MTVFALFACASPHFLFGAVCVELGALSDVTRCGDECTFCGPHTSKLHALHGHKRVRDFYTPPREGAVQTGSSTLGSHLEDARERESRLCRRSARSPRDKAVCQKKRIETEEIVIEEKGRDF